MKLLLFSINLLLFPFLVTTCNQAKDSTEMKNETDTLKMVTDTMPSSIDTGITKINGQPASSVNTDADTVSKNTKYGTVPEKKEAPKHDSPNQAKVDSIKQAKNKKKG